MSARVQSSGGAVEGPEPGGDPPARSSSRASALDDGLSPAGAIGFEALVERSPAVLFVSAGQDLRIPVYISPQLETMLGFSAGAWVAQPGSWLERVHPDDRARIEREWEAHSDLGTPLVTEYRMLSRSGEVRWVREAASLVEDAGRPPYWQGSLLDITPEKTAAREVEDFERATEGLRLEVERLREEEARYRTLVEQIPAIVYVDLIDGPDSGTWPTVYISPQLETILGYTPQEWMSDPLMWAAVLHPDDRGAAFADDRDYFESGRESGAYEYRVFAKDGSVVWLRDESVVIRDTDGTPRFGQGLLTDVTQLKMTEARLRDAEERYRSVVESIPAALFIRTAETRAFEYASPQVETMTGYPPEAWARDPDLWIRVIHPDDLEMVLAREARSVETGEALALDFRLVRRDGRIVWVHREAVLAGREATRNFWQDFLYDITASREAGEQLRQAEVKYRGLVEQIPAVTFIEEFTEDGRAGDIRDSFVSPQIEAMLGYSQEEWYADPGLWTGLLHPDDRQRVLAENARVDAAREPFSMEYRMVARDGRVVWCRDEGVLLEREDGPPAWHGIMLDITELKRAEEELERALELEREISDRLRAVDDMKNTFLTAVSHELRTPLTSIVGISATLDAVDVEEPDRRELVHALAGEARKLNDLLTDLLDVDRLSRGILEPKRRPTDLERLARSVVEDMSLQGVVTIDAEPVIVPVDPPMIERIVENLLTNATRHTPAGTPLWLKVKAEDAGAVIVVEDAGPGVAGDLGELIFEPFRQGPSARPHSPGVGIGLTLVARFAELHGGRAWVEERPGGGASFRVFLPARS